MRWPASIFLFAGFTLSKKFNYQNTMQNSSCAVECWRSPVSNKSQILLLSWHLLFGFHLLQYCRKSIVFVSRSNIVVKKNTLSEKEFLGAQSRVFLFFLVNRSSKDLSLLQEYLFSHLIFWWHAQSHGSSFLVVTVCACWSEVKWKFLPCNCDNCKLRFQS